MAVTFNSRRLRHERTMDARLTGEHRVIAESLGRVVLRTASSRSDGGDAIIPNTRRARTALKQAAWDEVLKPYYIGSGNDPFDGPTPRSPYARLLTDGIEGAVRIQAERQVALLQRTVTNQQVMAWLTGPRPLQASREMNTYDPYHLWVDPNGYRLSDRVWRASIDVRSRIDRLLDYHISQGTSAVRIAQLLEEFLTPGAARSRTRTPYGQEGSYAARRLARTEITAAAGRATVASSQANPFVSGVRWSLSLSHPCCDICDEYAAGGPNGDGIYSPEDAPSYPAHPHDLCNLSPVAAGDVAALIEQIRADIRARNPRALALQGLFNLEFLVAALLGGYLDETLEDLAA